MGNSEAFNEIANLRISIGKAKKEREEICQKKVTR